MSHENTAHKNLAQYPELSASLPAMHRAAQAARQLAMDTNTYLIVVQDGKIVHIPPQDLRRQQEAEAAEKMAAVKELPSCPAKN